MSKMKRNEYKLGAVLSYVSLGLKNIISLIYTPLMIRMLGQSEYGLYTLSNSVVGYLGILDMGFGNAVVRYTTKLRAEGDKEGEYSLIGMFILLYSIISLIIIFCGGLLVFNVDILFGKGLRPNELNIMKYLMILMVFNLAISLPFSVFSAIIIVHERFVFPKMLEILRSVLNPLIMIPLLLMGYKSITMTIVATLINILCIIVNVYYCFAILKIKIKFTKINTFVLNDIFGYSFFVFLNILVDKIYWSTDQLILGSMLGATAVAIYSVGSTINNYYMIFSTAISGMFLPRITKMVTKNSSDEELSNLFVKIGRIQYIIMSFILVGFILIGKEFVVIWAGEIYWEAYYIALVVMIPLTIPLIQNIGISILQAKNMHKDRSKIYIFIAILNVLITIPFVKLFGSIGAAIASGMALIIGNIIIINIYYAKKVGLDIIRFWKEILQMTIPVVICFIISKFIINFISLNGIKEFIIKGIIITLIFIPLMWIFGMNSYEKDLLLKPINKIVKRKKYKH
ncbi:lipopolysaccharide biosynthesis protein [Clostridium perfringens]|uniref:lipopolysaccharide biosynthesis protein n=1 Tax=Clostridium perfringens TaxID=1502 RepID=UPI00145956A2|nr:oligosaccharide flippase family protein [Clostridium perfringens]MBI6060435.1 oligosaccharide flippase family protein [Clostridium perfringens]NMF21129.1 oligosaccharide flippase family protein [Clostridium perfringens]